MTDPRPNSATYDMRCPIARTLEIVGERWTILILRDLVTGGPRKFQDFERSLTGISPNTLSARLKRLEEAGIVERRFYEQHPPRAEYVLTEKGAKSCARCCGPCSTGVSATPDTAAPTNNLQPISPSIGGHFGCIISCRGVRCLCDGEKACRTQNSLQLFQQSSRRLRTFNPSRT